MTLSAESAKSLRAMALGLSRRPVKGLGSYYGTAPRMRAASDLERASWTGDVPASAVS